MSSFDYARGWPKPAQPEAVHQQAAVALLILADIRAGSRLWGFARFVLGTLPLRGTEGLRFAKQLGSGEGGGFGLKPSLSIQGLFLAFDHAEQAQSFWQSHRMVRAYQDHALECFGLIASPLTARGSWSGEKPFADSASDQPSREPVAALTRASIRLRHAAAFWSRAPAAQTALAAHPDCWLAVGLGEAPLLRQATFSIWASAAAMDAYARSGAHLAAIRAASAGNYFSEDMFVRFKPLASFGSWKGQSLRFDGA